MEDSQTGGRVRFYKEKGFLDITSFFFFIIQELYAYSIKKKAFVGGCGDYLDKRLANICQFCYETICIKHSCWHMVDVQIC